MDLTKLKKLLEVNQWESLSKYIKQIEEGKPPFKKFYRILCIYADHIRYPELIEEYKVPLEHRSIYVVSKVSDVYIGSNATFSYNRWLELVGTPLEPNLLLSMKKGMLMSDVYRLLKNWTFFDAEITIHDSYVHDHLYETLVIMQKFKKCNIATDYCKKYDVKSALFARKYFPDLKVVIPREITLFESYARILGFPYELIELILDFADEFL